MTFIAIIIVLAVFGWRGLAETVILSVGAGLLALTYIYFVIPMIAGGLHG